MTKPDFRQTNQLIEDMLGFDEAFADIFSGSALLAETASGSCRELLLRKADEALNDIPVDELKHTRSGIRTQMLKDAGYLTLYDLHRAGDEVLLAIPGIGEKQLASIRAVTEEFQQQLFEKAVLTLDADRPDALTLRTITDLVRSRQAELVRADAEPLREEVREQITGAVSSIEIRSGLRWVFSLGKTRMRTLDGIRQLTEFAGSPLFSRARHFLSAYGKAAGITEDEALSDFRKNSAAVYAAAEKLSGVCAPARLLYNSIPEQLAASVQAVGLLTGSFRGDLRAYQAFGVRYILHQKRVLLGDEMGLGKTIQAMAAMAHLHAEDPGSHFLIVCPASVMINWCREIVKFSSIRVQLVHGTGRKAAFAKWQQDGGAAVSSYETIGTFTDEIDNAMQLALLIIDEAHYIKNPEAKRTKNLRRLEDEAERMLLMTGTPLENHVAEMCELIGLVRPDLEDAMRMQASMQFAPAFRELLSPVYLRRRREQVLPELPPLTEQEEWCTLSQEDALYYSREVENGNFMGMRRVSFLGEKEDLTSSAKAARLAELICEIQVDGGKAVIFSYFRETIQKVSILLQDFSCGCITGSTAPEERQFLVDRFTDAPAGSVLICQIQAGGIGLNLQAASCVIFCEPQIKPSLSRQALSRVYRMGQVRQVLVFYLLCENTVDEAVIRLLARKEQEFDLYADESSMAEAENRLADSVWIRSVIEEERRKYLPAVIPQA